MARRDLRSWWCVRTVLGLSAAWGLLMTAVASAQGPAAKSEAVAVVEGVVREVFRSPRQGRVDVLVQLDVQRSEAGKTPRGGVRAPCPAPGESVYVHLIQSADPNLPGRSIPAEQTRVRAYLVPRAEGGWEGTTPDWFELTTDPAPAPAPIPVPAPAPVPNPAPAPAPPSTPGGKVLLAGLGLSVEPLEARGRFALRVTGVERGGSGRRAGIEVGDIIAGANGAALKSVAQLEALSQGGGPLTLVVIDINSGKAAQVEIAPPAVADGNKPAPEAPAPTTPAAGRSLGISTETVSVGGRTALKVVRVDPASPSAKAGLEPGDILVGANGAAITGPEQLAAALRKSGPKLTLQVRDVRTGRDTPVEVALGGPERPAAPVDVPSLPSTGGATNPGASTTNRLGVVTELTFFDVELAVKVTELVPGGPAARAGLKLGTIIISADGQPMLHPNDLIEAARKASTAIKLTIADPQTSRKSDVTIDLRGQ